MTVFSNGLRNLGVVAGLHDILTASLRLGTKGR